jgi:hypothetical protein
VEPLAAERTVDDAPEVLHRIRRLLTRYRATEPELPKWCEAFVTAGYALRSLANVRYVGAETGYPGNRNGMLRARSGMLGPGEQFVLVPERKKTSSTGG